MCVSKVQHMTGQKTGFFWFFNFLTNVATGNWKNSEFVQPQPVVRSFAVGFSSISVFFPVQWTGPVNTTAEAGFQEWLGQTHPSCLCVDQAKTYPVHWNIPLGFQNLVILLYSIRKQIVNVPSSFVIRLDSQKTHWLCSHFTLQWRPAKHTQVDEEITFWFGSPLPMHFCVARGS